MTDEMEALKAQLRERIREQLLGPGGPRDNMAPTDWAQAILSSLIEVNAEVLAEIKMRAGK